jgi:intermembrane space import and assembly protein 40
VFAEEPLNAQLPATHEEVEPLPTLEVLEKDRAQRKAAAKAQAEKGSDAQRVAEYRARRAAEKESEKGAEQETEQETTEAKSPEELEEEAGQQGAFNPETGEINWDCPCLGGMANGPCGEEFKAAFSCFVYSTEEPKGMDCIEKFKGMQNCFREYPEIYGAELQEDEEDAAVDESGNAIHAETAPSSASEEQPPTQPHAEKVADREPAPETERQEKTERAQKATAQVQRDHEPVSESPEVVPKEWHDSTSPTQEKK